MFSFLSSLVTRYSTRLLHSLASSRSKTCSLWLGWRSARRSAIVHVAFQNSCFGRSRGYVYRLASRVKRPIKMSWTSRAWSAPSRCQRGDDHTSSLACVEKCATSWVASLRRPPSAVWTRRFTFLFLFLFAPQFAIRAWWVAWGHNHGHRRLHQEEDHLHLWEVPGWSKSKKSRSLPVVCAQA